MQHNNSKGMVKLSSARREDRWGVEVQPQITFNLNTRRTSVISMTPQPPYCRGISPDTHWGGGRADKRVGLEVLEGRTISFPWQESDSPQSIIILT